MFSRSTGLPVWLKWTLISAIAVTAIAVSTLVFLTAGVYARTFSNIPVDPAISSTGDSPALLPVGDSQPLVVELDKLPITRVAINASEQASIPTAEPIPTLENDARMTILVMGLDRRTGENFISRTDSMMLLSLDPANQTASMMSVPRDLYVDIPGYSRQRINTAFFLGALYGGDGETSGAELAMQTIERNIGVPVDHYVLIDFDTVMSVIDTFGGVTIDVENTIVDNQYPDMNYGYDPLYIPAGENVMDGELALKYMRTRHGSTDFDRSQRQQQLILAFRDQVLASGITGISRRIPAVYQTVTDGIFTDLTVRELTSVLMAGIEINPDNIQRGVLDYNYVYSHTTERGESVLILRTTEVADLINQLFN